MTVGDTVESPLGEDPILSTMESGPKPRTVGLFQSCPYGVSGQITQSMDTDIMMLNSKQQGSRMMICQEDTQDRKEQRKPRRIVLQKLGNPANNQ